jgi:hypothetical protein
MLSIVAAIRTPGESANSARSGMLKRKTANRQMTSATDLNFKR